jgi:hypothetical protein
MHIRMIQGGPVSVFTQDGFSGYCTRLIVGTSHQMISSSSVIYIKQELTEHGIPDWQSLKSTLTHVFGEIVQETLMTIFETWINRFEWVMKREKEYFHQ